MLFIFVEELRIKEKLKAFIEYSDNLNENIYFVDKDVFEMDNKVNTVLPSLYKSQTYKKDKKDSKDAVQENVVQDEVVESKDEAKSYELTLSGSVSKTDEEKTLQEKLREMEENKIKQMFTLPDNSELEKLKEMLAKMKKQRFETLLKSARSRFAHQYTKESWKGLARLMAEALSTASRGGNESANLEKAIATLQRGLNGLRFCGIKKEYKNVYTKLPDDPYKDPRVTAQEAFLKRHSQSHNEAKPSPVPTPREDRTTTTTFYDSNAGVSSTTSTAVATSTVEEMA